MKTLLSFTLVAWMALLTSCSTTPTPVLMPNGQSLPQEQSAALAALRAQKSVTITSTGPDHISWNTKPSTQTGTDGRRMKTRSTTKVGFLNGVQSGELHQEYKFDYVD